MATVIDPRTGRAALIMPCRSCNRPVFFGLTAAGKRCPYDVVDGEPTGESHFRTCTEPQKWSRKKGSVA